MEPNTVRAPDGSEQPAKEPMSWPAGIAWFVALVVARILAAKYYFYSGTEPLEDAVRAPINTLGLMGMVWIVAAIYKAIRRTGPPKLRPVLWGTTIVGALELFGAHSRMENAATSASQSQPQQSVQATTVAPQQPAAPTGPNPFDQFDAKPVVSRPTAELPELPEGFQLDSTQSAASVDMLATLEQKAAQNDAAAMTALGRKYAWGNGAPKDTAKALGLYQRAIALGNIDAKWNLGFMYDKGNGVPKDTSKAMALYQEAAAQGNAYAQVMLGGMYSQGDGVPKNDATAVAWYQLAAAQGNASAQGDLGGNYWSGEGVPQDDVLAYAWINLAASGGDQTNATMRSIVAKEMTPAQISEAQQLSSSWVKGQLLVRGAR